MISLPRESYKEDRIIYMIKPEYLAEDALRILHKLGISPSVSRREGLWDISGYGSEGWVGISIRSSRKILPLLRSFGPMYISEVKVRAEGSKDFLNSLRYRLNIETLRGGG